MELLVDAMNVVGSRPDGWWRDREGAVRRLIERLVALAAGDRVSITVVIDGFPYESVPEGADEGVTVLYAHARGANAADDRIVAELEQHEDPDAITVVTSDRALRLRAQALGATVVGVGTLLARLDARSPRRP